MIIFERMFTKALCSLSLTLTYSHTGFYLWLSFSPKFLHCIIPRWYYKSSFELLHHLNHPKSIMLCLIKYDAWRNNFRGRLRSCNQRPSIMAKATCRFGNAFCPSSKLVCVSFVVLVWSSLFTVVDAFCYPACGSGQICCGDECFFGSSCLGLYCNNYYDSVCSSGESCCQNSCVNGSSCQGQSCWSNSDCSFGETCCNGKCEDGIGCIGHSCFEDSDCGSGENCCDKTCQYDDCPGVSVLAVSAIVGSIFVLFVIAIAALVSYRLNINRPRRVLLGQTVAQAYQSQGQTPPPYQQFYPYYPPPKYEQYPPTEASETPPPYNAAPQGTSERLNTPQPSYGAVPNSSTGNQGAV